MKNFTKTWMLLTCLAFSVAGAKADHLADRLTFSARLQAAQNVTTDGHAVAAFMLNSTMDTMYFTISAAKLTSAINGYHIHNSRTGGNVIVDFDGKVHGNTVRSFITGNDLKAWMPDFLAGNLYVAVHTVNNPGAEIFGYVKLETDWNFFAMLDGTQAGSGATGVGHANINFSMKGDTAIVRVATSGLSSKMSAVHLHYGKAGQSGGVALGLESTIAMDSLSLVGGVAVLPATWTNLMAALMKDSVYLNIHTPANPGGEIRGQLMTTKKLHFDAWLNQAQITAGGGTPSKASMAYGVSTLTLNASFDTLWYNVLFTGLTSNATMAHFHNAEPNASGAVVKDLMPMGNMISGMWTKTDATQPLTPMLISELLKGNLYFVIHTDSNPGGEIRGNVTRLAREGFIAEINGTQAVTNSGGQGTAVASYDRDRTNLHYMIAFDGLGSDVTMAHFHKAVAGQSGGVIFDLDMPVNNGYYNYWTAANGFNNAQSLPLRRNDSIYINIHTTNMPGGEIRGQLMRYYRISSETMDTTGSVGFAENLINTASVSVYPNPFAASFEVSFDSRVNGDGAVALYDITGRMVSIQNIKVHAGVNTIQVDAQTVNSGLYFTSLLINGQAVINQKLIKN